MDQVVFALVLVFICAVTAAWALLLHWTGHWLRPRLERWIWRKLGGTGEPPAR